MVRIALVEDEDMYAQTLQGFLHAYEKEKGAEFSIVRFCDGDEIAENYTGDFDLILMDIQMRFMDGYSAAKKIREMDEQVLIMFITNMTDYAIRGYEVDALDYILKPVTYYTFARKLERALSRISRDEEKVIALKVKEGVRKVRVKDILYVETLGHDLIYHLGGRREEEIRLRGKMQSAEEELEGCGFFRINRGYLVSLNAVEGIENGCAVIGGERLVISGARKQAFMDALAEYLTL